MKHTSENSGYLVCVLLNMILNWEIGAVAFVLWVIAMWFGVSFYPAIAALIAWIALGVIITGIFAWAGSGENSLKTNNELPNVNPYSVKK